MQPDKETTVKQKNRTETASSGSSGNSSSPCFSDQSSDIEHINSSDDDDNEEENSRRSTPGPKQQSCLKQNLQNDIQPVMTSTPEDISTKRGDSERRTGIFF